MPTIYVRTSKKELVDALRLLPAMIAGTARDPYGLSKSIKAVMSLVFYSKVRRAFLTKARGGTDEAGISWPPLSAKYLAYGRPQQGRQPPRAGGLAPGGKDGFLSKAELAQWRHKYSLMLALLAPRMGISKAKGIAAATAWQELKDEGAKTKLEEFGSRTDVEILRDRGILLNSLSPGTVGQGDYRPKTGDQIHDESLGEVALGTRVPYAKAHHEGKGVPKRQLWPDGNQFPSSWWEAIFEQTGQAVIRVLYLIAGGRTS